MIDVAVVGGSGYTGVELIRLLLNHPKVNLKSVTSRSENGRPLTSYFPSFIGHPQAESLVFSLPELELLTKHDLVFFATPNGTAMKLVPGLLAAGVKVIDLAADFRLKDAQEWSEWYGIDHAAPELLAEAVYGLADLYPEAVTGSNLVANPGCFPTAVQLVLKPLIECGLINTESSIIADCKSGVSGAGRSGKVGHSFAEVAENFQAYGVEGHRHWPEIHQGLGGSNRVKDFTFIPHLVPMSRGIFATIYADFSTSHSQNAAQAVIAARQVLKETYTNSPFVFLLHEGEVPQTKSVRCSNKCYINVFQAASGKLVLTAAIDNLVKGAAGQAVQNMNLMLGFPTEEGIQSLGITP